MDSSPPGSSVHGLSTARILEWVAVSFSRVSSWPRDQTCEPVSSALSGRFFTTKPLGKPQTLVWQQWDSIMIPRVWLFLISILFKTSANSFWYKYLLIVVHLWLVSGPGRHSVRGISLLREGALSPGFLWIPMNPLLTISCPPFTS